MTRVYEEQRVAERFAARLSNEGRPCTVVGNGVHWQVDVHAGHRSLTVHCFWYGPAAALMLGMNPGNGRARLGPQRLPYEGHEFLVRLRDHGGPVAAGRTRDEDAMAACVHAWSSDVSLDAMVERVPFVDAGPRALRVLGARLPEVLRTKTHTAHDDHLWVYGDDLRACAFDESGACSFRYGQAQLARAASVDVVSATTAWLLAGTSLDQLPHHVAGVVLERHGRWAETDAARWHWLHLLDRADDPNDVLAPLAELIRALSVRPLPRTFFTYSSLSALCFSASSHYPWVDQGLPRIVRSRDGYELAHRLARPRRAAVSLTQAVDEIESALGQCSVAPFYGTSDDVARQALTRELAERGSSLVPRLERRGAWTTLVVARDERRCEVFDLSVSTNGGRFQCASMAELARRVDELLRA